MLTKSNINKNDNRVGIMKKKLLINPTRTKSVEGIITGYMTDCNKTRDEVCHLLAGDVRAVSLYSECVLNADGYTRVGGDKKNFDVIKDNQRYEVRCVGTDKRGKMRGLQFSPSSTRGMGRQYKSKKEAYRAVKDIIGKLGGFIFFIYDDDQMKSNGTVNYYLLTIDEIEKHIEHEFDSSCQLTYNKFVKIWNNQIHEIPDISEDIVIRAQRSGYDQLMND